MAKKLSDRKYARKAMKTLQRRADFLSNRILDMGGKGCAYDLSERNALLWALERLGEAENQQDLLTTAKT